jgi:putative chitinase
MLLKNGSKGEEVKQLQTLLGLSADGSFGPMTETKVKEWQAANGLAADGIVGDRTWGKMFGAVAPTPVATVIPPSSFKLDALKGHIPDAVIAQIPDTAAKFNITNPLRLAHFLAQCGHESGGFKSIMRT